MSLALSSTYLVPGKEFNFSLNGSVCDGMGAAVQFTYSPKGQNFVVSIDGAVADGEFDGRAGVSLGW